MDIVKSEVKTMITKSKLKVRSSRALKHQIAMAGLTTKRLAESVDITASYASNIINGKANPGPTTALKIALELSKRLNENMGVNDIFFDVTVKKNATLNFIEPEEVS
ncbi:hypothetical protein DA477_04850 [Levilactobacillus brevis]|uniref:helix-turn-helix transcriptional regulator n=1 Tax=Levilactobacillus brevis TaxID=1580 RepID=UPI000D36E0CE|nr:helix-turn-helix transcriptional regulator [Levilactobacillus brevis]PUD97063.1 hypothetical protein DA477_04850 [Levilactobacillus brevis]